MEDVKARVVMELQEIAGQIFKAREALPMRKENMDTLKQLDDVWRKCRDLAETLAIREVEL